MTSLSERQGGDKQSRTKTSETESKNKNDERKKKECKGVFALLTGVEVKNTGGGERNKKENPEQKNKIREEEKWVFTRSGRIVRTPPKDERTEDKIGKTKVSANDDIKIKKKLEQAGKSEGGKAENKTTEVLDGPEEEKWLREMFFGSQERVERLLTSTIEDERGQNTEQKVSSSDVESNTDNKRKANSRLSDAFLKEGGRETKKGKLNVETATRKSNRDTQNSEKAEKKSKGRYNH